jgi:hypothetical protein
LIKDYYNANFALITHTVKLELNKSMFTYKLLGVKNDSTTNQKNIFTYNVEKLPCKIEDVKFFKYTYNNNTIKFTISDGIATNIDTQEHYNSKVELYKAAGHVDGIGINFYRDVTIINQNMMELKFKQ